MTQLKKHPAPLMNLSRAHRAHYVSPEDSGHGSDMDSVIFPQDLWAIEGPMSNFKLCLELSIACQGPACQFRRQNSLCRSQQGGDFWLQRKRPCLMLTSNFGTLFSNSISIFRGMFLHCSFFCSLTARKWPHGKRTFFISPMFPPLVSTGDVQRVLDFL